MPTGDTPRVLGTLAGLDDARLETGVIVGGRFCIVGDRRTLDETTVVPVTDLARKLGDAASQHRLELHLLPVAREPRAEARLRRACAIESHVQPRVFALERAGDRFVLVCEPVAGRTLDDAPTLALRKLAALGVQLASLLAQLHAANVDGVRFSREMLRLDDGHLGLDRFTHLLPVGNEAPAEIPAQQRDVAALIELLRSLAGPELELTLGVSTSATELREQLMQLGELPPAPQLPGEPPFVGRSRALGELGRGLDQAQIAQPTALVVQGQRGVGKSRLLSQFVAARAAADDAIVLTGAWQEHSADSRGGLLNALEQLPEVLAELGLDERDDIRRRINRATRHLGAIVTRSAPSLGAVLRNVEELPPLELGEDFSRHTAVIADLLRSIGTPKRPLVLALDNLESIDASSAAVLKILTQSRPAHHTLVITGLRSEAGYEPDFDFQAIELAPLGVADIEQLLDDALPGEIADVHALSQTLWSISNGLPLAAWTNLRAWIDRGRLIRGLDDGVWRTRGRLRDDGSRLEVYDVFGARLAAATPRVRELALRIAVLGVELGASELAALARTGNIDEAIDDLIDRGILTRTAHGVRFPHDSIRELVFESFDEQQRRDAHAHAAELLIQQKAPVAQIAYHRDLALDPEASAETFDRLSRLHVDAGRERLAVYDLERARWHLERALEHSRDPEQRSLAAEGLADICLLLDDVDTAVSLYTAIIATSEPAHAVGTAAKAVAFLFSKSANTEARQLAHMALEVVSEPIPTSSIGKIAALIGSVFRSWFTNPKMDMSVRDPVCRLYSWLTIMSLVDDPLAMPMYVARGHWISKGLESGAAAMVRSIEGSMWAALGRYDKANEIFAAALAIAQRANDSWAQGWANHNWGHVSLLPSDRYEEGQDLLDDAIAAFRETGDVSISILSIMFKGLYGRDREPANVVLGWFEEAMATARRHGKFVATASLEALKLHVLARQGRTDLEERFVALASQIEADDMTGIERLMARVYLAHAAYEAKSWDIAVAQVRAGQDILGELPGIPEYCQELHLITVLVMLERPQPTAADRKLLRYATRKFRRAAKGSPRLRILAAHLDLQLAVHANELDKARRIASGIVAEFDVHENLHVTRMAHLTLSRLLKGENVLAAAEHDRVARNLGRRLGLQDRALLSEFSDVEEEVGMLALSIEGSLKLDESQHDLPPAGMLESASPPPAPRKRTTTSPPLDTQADVLEAWALTSTTPQYTVVGEIIEPVRGAVRGSLESNPLSIRCADPQLEVPISSGDLQILLINLLLACRDTVEPGVPIEAVLERETLDGPPRAAFEQLTSNGSQTPEPGPYLAVRVSAPSPTNHVPILNAYSTCERIVQNIGGHLSATADRKRVTLTARIPLGTGERPAASTMAELFSDD